MAMHCFMIVPSFYFPKHQPAAATSQCGLLMPHWSAGMMRDIRDSQAFMAVEDTAARQGELQV